jgi:hypothetical protein
LLLYNNVVCGLLVDTLLVSPLPLHSGCALWGRQFEEWCRETQRQFISKRDVITLKSVIEEYFANETPLDLESATWCNMCSVWTMGF